MQVGSPWAHPHQPNHDKCVPTTTPFESLWVFSHLKKVPSFHIGGHCSLLTLWRELGRELSLSNERVIFHPQYILTTVTGRAILLDASVGSHCDVWKSQTPLQRERERDLDAFLSTPTSLRIWKPAIHSTWLSKPNYARSLFVSYILRVHM